MQDGPAKASFLRSFLMDLAIYDCMNLFTFAWWSVRPLHILRCLPVLWG